MILVESFEEIFFADQESAEIVFVWLLFQQFEAESTYPGFVKRIFVFQTLFIEGNHLKEIFLFFLEFAFWVFLHQLLYLLLYDCEFQTQIILASQDLQDFTESNT